MSSTSHTHARHLIIFMSFRLRGMKVCVRRGGIFVKAPVGRIAFKKFEMDLRKSNLFNSFGCVREQGPRRGERKEEREGERWVGKPLIKLAKNRYQSYCQNIYALLAS